MFRALTTVAALALTLAACAGPVVPDAPPPPAPRAVPPPVPRPTPAPLAGDWQDWPATPGDWRYAREGRGSVARFGLGASSPLLALRCEDGRLTMIRSGGGATATVRTTSLTRALSMSAGEGGSAATLGARDPLLDAMGFSRGRFVIESAPAQPLVVPAWAEVLRVIEDCRD